MAPMTTDASAILVSAAAVRDDSRDVMRTFVADAHVVARAADPMLAGLLEGIIGHGASEDTGTGWRGERRDGLELCRRLLTYLRQDVSDRRLDVSLGYIAGELAATKPGIQIRRH